MQRIDGPFNVSTKPDPSPPANSPGYFSGGDPMRGRKATRVTKDWLNRVQEEICSVIAAAGIDLDRTDDTQLLQALRVLFGLSPGGPGGFKPLEPGDFEFFYRPSPPPGWAVGNGGLLIAADTAAPKLWAELQKPAKAWLLKNQAQWNALSQAAPWNGIGGVPFFVLDVNAKTIRLPDVRGMYVETAGFDNLAVGGVHGDAIRNITGSHYYGRDADSNNTVNLPTGAFSYGAQSYDSVNQWTWLSQVGMAYSWLPLLFNASQVVPTAAVNRPRAFGALGCFYIGGKE